jgi:hypothetical protein
MPNNLSIDAKKRIRALFDAIIEEAEQNPQFAESVMDIFADTPCKASSRKKSEEKKFSLDFSPLEILHKEGEEALRSKLDALTNDDLIKACSGEGIVQRKNAQSMAREDLILNIVKSSHDRLRQGESFTK